MIDKSIRYFYAGGSVPPRRVEIKGQDHMLAYITPQEGELLRAQGGSGRPGPMGIPSFEIDPEELERIQERQRAQDKRSGIAFEKDYGPQGPGGTYIHPEADPNYGAPAEPPALGTSPAEPPVTEQAPPVPESPAEALNPVLSSGPVSIPTSYSQTFPINVAPVFPATPPYPTGGSPFVRPQQLPNPFVRPQGSAMITPGEVLMRARGIT